MSAFYPDSVPILMLLVAFNALFTGFLIILKRRDRSGFQYFLSNLFTFGWALGFSFLMKRDIPLPQAEFWGRFSQICLLMIAATWFHTVLTYIGQTKRWQANVKFVYAICIIMLLIVPTRAFILGYANVAGIHFYPIPGPGLKTLVIIFMVLMSISFFELYRYWSNEKVPLKKNDARFFFWTQLYGYGLTAMTLLPIYGWEIEQYQLFFLPFWQFFLAYAMVRHDLLDYEALARTMHRDRLAAMSTITATMHHELKNPITVIKTFAEYLPKKYDDPDFRQKFKEIVSDEAKRVNDLLMQLLEFSKPADPQMEYVSVNEVIKETLEFLDHNLRPHGIDVKTKYNKLPELKFDRNQMKQVFLNLVVNSVQAMPEGGRLTVETAKNDKGYVVVNIADTGVGIPQENLDQIGNPFFTTKTKGTGLGLAIVEQILRRHQAEMMIDSKEGQGTAIQIYFKTNGRPISL